METLVKHRRTREGRLTREEWLAKALEVLARKGVAGMRIDALSKALGVTKGSFYWHFKNRDDFTKNLLDYWMSAFTTNVRHRSQRRV